MAIRNNIQDFMRDVRARGINGGTSQNLYGASLNADNTTVAVTKNGAALFSKVYWNIQGSSPITDASSPNEDTVTIVDGSGFGAPGSAQAFINNLV